MNLKETLEKIIAPLGFSEAEKTEVMIDLTTMIALAVVGQVAQRSETVDDSEILKKAIELKDYIEIRRIINKIVTNPNYQNEVNAATIEVIKSWIDSVLPTISTDKQEELKKVVGFLNR